MELDCCVEASLCVSDEAVIDHMIEGGLAVAELGAGTETCTWVVLPPASPCLVPILGTPQIRGSPP